VWDVLWAFSNGALAGVGPANASTQRRDFCCRFAAGAANERWPTQCVVVVRVSKKSVVSVCIVVTRKHHRSDAKASVVQRLSLEMPDSRLFAEVTNNPMIFRHSFWVGLLGDGDGDVGQLMARGAELGTVEDRYFPISGFRLQNGIVMPQVKIAYETYGRLAADGRNAALIAHGYTSSHHAAGRHPANGDQAGWWDGLIGPGKAIDTEKLFVVSSNMLGSSSGSTNGASLDHDTGKPTDPISRRSRCATSWRRKRRYSIARGQASDRRRRPVLRRLSGLQAGRPPAPA
jgi:hypothetical protein